jgi:predicted small metal-binding protein
MEHLMSKRVIECNICGEPLAAANDDELVRALRTHLEAEHEGSEMDETQAGELIAAEAYEAGDS